MNIWYPRPRGAPSTQRSTIRTLTLFVTLLLAPPAQALDENDVRIYRDAFRQMDAGRFDLARSAAEAARDRLPAKIIQWSDLSRPDSPASFDVFSAFIRANPSWPALVQMRRRAELVMPQNLAAASIREWFSAYPPLTALGTTRFAEALIEEDDIVAATQLVRRRWASGPFSLAEEQDFLARFQMMLRWSDHWARIDRLLWEGEIDAARRLVPRLPGNWQELSATRIRLMQNDPEAPRLAAALPAEVNGDPGLHFERLRFARRSKADDVALELLLSAPPHPGRDAPWWNERLALYQSAVDRGNYAVAYELVREHGQVSGARLARAEWLAGWTALHFLSQPQQAFEHFENLYRQSTTPISIARGAYWAGYAKSLLGSREEAESWYGRAARYPTAFYGQLALARMASADLPLPVERKISAADSAAFDRRDLVLAIRALAQIEGRTDKSGGERTGIFLRRLLEVAESATDHALTGRLALELGYPTIAVRSAKQVLEEVVLVETGYPVVRYIGKDGPEPALVHSLIRQESEFNPEVVSPAGARGLMQLMPATAQQVSTKLGVKYTQARLTGDPDFNVSLGSTYLQEMLSRFNGSYVLAIAAYNAGPGRVRQWLEQLGDPRAEGVNVIEWVEMIPFYETQNYVQRVLEGLQIYRQRLDGKKSQLNILKDLSR